jgi:hypothetical protein
MFRSRPNAASGEFRDTSSAEGPSLIGAHAPPGRACAPATLWFQRISLIVFVVFCIELGMVLAVLPWTRVWTENSLLMAYPAARLFAHNNFVRGVISGLGLLDIWIGIWEAVHYREGRKR